MDGMEQKFIAAWNGSEDEDTSQWGTGFWSFDDAKHQHQACTETALDWKDIYMSDNSKMSVCEHSGLTLFVLPINVPKAR